MQARLDPPRHLPSIAATSVALCLVIAARPAHGQVAEAEALFNEASGLMTEGKLVQACEAFEASNRVEPRAGTLIRLAECREQNHQLASAWSAYKDALTRVKDPHKRAVATAGAAALEPRLSFLTVSVSDESRVEGLTLTRNGAAFDPMLWNRALPVDGGDYVIAGRAPGHEEWQTTTHVPVEGAHGTVEVPKFKELTRLIVPPPPARIAAGPTTTEPHDRAAQPSATFTTRRMLALGIATAGVISAGAGVVLWTTATSKQRDAYELCPDPATPCTNAAGSNALIRSAQHRALAANLAFGAAAVAAVSAGALWFTGAPRTESSARVGVVVHLDPATPRVAFTGSF